MECSRTTRVRSWEWRSRPPKRYGPTTSAVCDCCSGGSGRAFAPVSCSTVAPSRSASATVWPACPSRRCGRPPRRRRDGARVDQPGRPPVYNVGNTKVTDLADARCSPRIRTGSAGRSTMRRSLHRAGCAIRCCPWRRSSCLCPGVAGCRYDPRWVTAPDFSLSIRLAAVRPRAADATDRAGRRGNAVLARDRTGRVRTR